MKVLHTADVHVGVTSLGTIGPSGSSRVADFAATLDRFVDAVIEQQVDLAILSGDLFNGRRPGPQELRLVARALGRLAGKTETEIVGGNHDGATVIGDPATHTLGWIRTLAESGRLPGIHVSLTDEVRVVGYGGQAVLVTLPYPHKRALDPGLKLDPVARTEAVSRVTEGLIEARTEEAARMAQGLPILFAGHLTVAGSRLGAERAMQMGYDVSVRAELFDPYAYAALGHIHTMQRLPGSRAYYPGSPEYTKFDEAGQRKGFLLAEIGDGSGPPKVGIIPSGARPMLVYEVEQRPDGSLPSVDPALRWRGTGGVETGWESGPIVQLVVRASARGLDTADRMNALKSQLLRVGASYVEPKLVLPEQGPRSAIVTESGSAVDASTDPAEALNLWLTAKGYPVEPALSFGRAIIDAHR